MSLNPFLLLFLILLLIILAILYKSKDDVIANTIPLNFQKYGGMEFVDDTPEPTKPPKPLEPPTIEKIIEPPKQPTIEKIIEPLEPTKNKEEIKTPEIEVVYDRKYNNGEKIDYKIAKEQPIIKYNNVVDSKFYTIMMVDPDVPSYQNPIEKEWRHWVVGNIPGKILQEGLKISDLANTTVLTAYNGPMPGVATSWHRYYFKLYEQPKHLPWYPIGGPRNKWKSADFASAHELLKVAQTYLLCKRDFDGRKNRASEIIQKIQDLQ